MSKLEASALGPTDRLLVIRLHDLKEASGHAFLGRVVLFSPNQNLRVKRSFAIFHSHGEGARIALVVVGGENALSEAKTIPRAEGLQAHLCCLVRITLETCLSRFGGKFLKTIVEKAPLKLHVNHLGKRFDLTRGGSPDGQRNQLGGFTVL